MAAVFSDLGKMPDASELLTIDTSYSRILDINKRFDME